jgi:hypothetical protein
MGEMKIERRSLVGKPEVERGRSRHRHKWEDNIRVDLMEVGWKCVHWIRLDLDRDQWRAVVNTVMNLRVL